MTFSTCWSLFVVLWCNVALTVMFLLFTYHGFVQLDLILWPLFMGVHVWTLVSGVASLVVFWHYREDTVCSPEGVCTPALIVFIIALVLLLLFAIDSVTHWSRCCRCDDVDDEDSQVCHLFSDMGCRTVCRVGSQAAGPCVVSGVMSS